ncbi:MAG: YhgE/Pip protein [Microbacteriaceae bacterium]|nr:YhgE/Pip protein [Microbacteriaceae bacterium]
MSQSSMPAARTKWLRRGAIAAVVFVPLAFAGLSIGALAQAGTAVNRIPAAIVNSDQLVYQTAADGTKTPVFAGRQLVTELTGGSKGFNWTITNKADADKALANGTVDAILTVPKDFSSSILSLTSSHPKQADLAIHTDDAHSYLTGAVAQAVGDGMVNTFGTTITEQYISGIYASVGQLGSSLSTAASGADGLAGGATNLSGGLTTLSSGAASASSGAASLSAGVTKYTGGVDALSGGLSTLTGAAANLSPLSQGVAGYAAGIADLSSQLAAANTDLQNGVSGAAARIATISGELTAATGQLSPLVAQNVQLSSGVATGVSQSASGAAQLAGGSASLRSGASSLASGVGGLSTGAASAASGASQLASGAGSLASGLKSGAAQLPTTDAAASAKSAKIAADPVGLTVTRDNQISNIGQVIATFFVPLGLWVGALATFLVLRPITRRVLASTAANGRLVASTLVRAGAVTGLQALLLVALLHLGVGVPWSSLPATLGFSLVMALAFTAFHYLLTIGLGRAGLVVSLFLLAIQVTSTGGLYPVQLLATPFQWISPLLPLTYGVQGMQGIIAGGDAGPAVIAALTLLAFGVGSVLVATLAIRRTRRAQALGLTLPSSVRAPRIGAQGA